MHYYLEDFINDIRKEQLCLNYIQVSKDGKVVDEYLRLPVKTRLNTWSACKGVVSCAFGIAQSEGLITLDDKLADIFPEYISQDTDENLGNVTMRHLLTMTSGLESSLFFCDWEERYTTPDWIRYFFNRGKIVHPPGSKWLYSNFNTFMVSCAIEKIAGCNLLDYLRYRFFEKIEITNPDWTMAPNGHVHAANGLYLTIDEFSKYGELIKNRGWYKGKQVVPEAYMAEATTRLVDNEMARSETNVYTGYGYGYQFVMNPEPGSYRSDGNYGQWCLAFPKENMVVAVMSLEGEYERIGNLLWKDVVRKIVC